MPEEHLMGKDGDKDSEQLTFSTGGAQPVTVGKAVVMSGRKVTLVTSSEGLRSSSDAPDLLAVAT